MMTKISEVLERATNILADPDNWTKHMMTQEKETTPDSYRYCVVGAVREALQTQDRVDSRTLLSAGVQEEEIASEITAVLREQYPHKSFPSASFFTFLNITCWNDAPETTHAEVVAVLEKACCRAREQGK